MEPKVVNLNTLDALVSEAAWNDPKGQTNKVCMEVMCFKILDYIESIS